MPSRHDLHHRQCFVMREFHSRKCCGARNAGRAVLEELFIGKIGIQRSRGEQYQRRIGYGALQLIFLNIGLQVVMIAKPLAQVLRLLAVHIVQTDFTKLPISRSNKSHSTVVRAITPVPITPRVPLKGLGEICSAADAAGGSARSTDQRCLDTGQRITRRRIVQNQDCRRSG